MDGSDHGRVTASGDHLSKSRLWALPSEPELALSVTYGFAFVPAIAHWLHFGERRGGPGRTVDGIGFG